VQNDILSVKLLPRLSQLAHDEFAWNLISCSVICSAVIDLRVSTDHFQLDEFPHPERQALPEDNFGSQLNAIFESDENSLSNVAIVAFRIFITSDNAVLFDIVE